MQSFIVYDKSYEQRTKHENDDYNAYSYLRMEYSLYWQKLKQNRSKYRILGMTHDDRNNPVNDLFFFSNASVLMMYDIIDRLFPDGEILSRKKFLRKIDKIPNYDVTKDMLNVLVTSLSKANTYDDTIRISEALKEKYGKNQFHYALSVLEKYQISPIYLRRSDEALVSSLPSIKKIYMSGIASSLDEMNHFNTISS